MARREADAATTPDPASETAPPRTPRTPTRLNPFLGKPGFYNRFNALIYNFTGPAQVGIGRPEAPYVPPADPRCPLCGQSMAGHRIDRSGERTQVHCPSGTGAGPGSGTGA